MFIKFLPFTQEMNTEIAVHSLMFIAPCSFTHKALFQGVHFLKKSHTLLFCSIFIFKRLFSYGLFYGPLVLRSPSGNFALTVADSLTTFTLHTIWY